MNGITAIPPATLAAPAAADAPSVADTQRHLRLVSAAQQFEGMMLEQILKPMQKSQDSGFGQDPDTDRDSSLDTMSSYGTEAVANAIAKSGGLGIARKLVADVTRLDARNATRNEAQNATRSEAQNGVRNRVDANAGQAPPIPASSITELPALKAHAPPPMR